MSCGKCENCSCKNKTTEETMAVMKFLAKPAPTYHPCGCLGPMPLHGEENKPYDEQKRQPVCPCRMQLVEEVHGKYYKISEHRWPTGIEVSAQFIGEVGGPYTLD